MSGTEQELTDAALELRRHAESIEPDEKRLSELDELISQLNRLMQKHGCVNEEGLLAKKNELSTLISNHKKNSESFSELENEAQRLEGELEEMAQELHIRRKEASVNLENSVADELGKLGLPHSAVKIDLSDRAELNKYGKTQFKLLFSPNKGMPMAEAGKTASGGEMSRLMLILKSQLAQHIGLPTLIFDEIDTGVSGEIGQKMGSILKKMAHKKQVICITHLPQIAAAGEHHYFVYKQEKEDATASGIRKLDGEHRILEIAKMLSGDRPTEGAMSNAKELLLSTAQG